MAKLWGEDGLSPSRTDPRANRPRPRQPYSTSLPDITPPRAKKNSTARALDFGSGRQGSRSQQPRAARRSTQRARASFATPVCGSPGARRAGLDVQLPPPTPSWRPYSSGSVVKINHGYMFFSDGGRSASPTLANEWKNKTTTRGSSYLQFAKMLGTSEFVESVQQLGGALRTKGVVCELAPTAAVTAAVRDDVVAALPVFDPDTPRHLANRAVRRWALGTIARAFGAWRPLQLVAAAKRQRVENFARRFLHGTKARCFTVWRELYEAECARQQRAEEVARRWWSPYARPFAKWRALWQEALAAKRRHLQAVRRFVGSTLARSFATWNDVCEERRAALEQRLMQVVRKLLHSSVGSAFAKWSKVLLGEEWEEALRWHVRKAEQEPADLRRETWPAPPEDIARLKSPVKQARPLLGRSLVARVHPSHPRAFAIPPDCAPSHRGAGAEVVEEERAELASGRRARARVHQRSHATADKAADSTLARAAATPKPVQAEPLPDGGGPCEDQLPRRAGSARTEARPRPVPPCRVLRFPSVALPLTCTLFDAPCWGNHRKRVLKRCHPLPSRAARRQAPASGNRGSQSRLSCSRCSERV